MKRIDWKFAILVTAFALLWGLTLEFDSEGAVMPYAIGGSLLNSLPSFLSDGYRELPEIFVLAMLTAAFLIGFSFIIREIWNRFLKSIFPKLLDIRIAEVYVLLIILPILTGYLI